MAIIFRHRVLEHDRVVRHRTLSIQRKRTLLQQIGPEVENLFQLREMYQGALKIHQRHRQMFCQDTNCLPGRDIIGPSTGEIYYLVFLELLLLTLSLRKAQMSAQRYRYYVWRTLISNIKNNFRTEKEFLFRERVNKKC